MTVATLSIHSRRYLGCKRLLLPDIQAAVNAILGRPPHSLIDLFAGTGVVADSFNRKTTLFVNDHLYSNYVCLDAFLGTIDIDRARLRRALQEMNRLDPSTDNYVSEVFGGTYFSRRNARRIGAMRRFIAECTLPEQEKRLLLTGLLYETDRIANTVGHFDAYRLSGPEPFEIRVRLPAVDTRANRGNRIFCRDANQLAGEVEAEVLFLDPPYNSRQYCDTYHLLENLARWEQPPVFGKAAKMDRRALKSDYCRNRAPESLADLLSRTSCPIIILTYNNTGDNADIRSRARIRDDQLESILSKYGTVSEHVVPYRDFRAGKSQRQQHCERIYTVVKR